MQQKVRIVIHQVLGYCSKQRLLCHEFKLGHLIRGPVAGEIWLKVVTERVSLYDITSISQTQALSHVIMVGKKGYYGKAQTLALCRHQACAQR